MLFAFTQNKNNNFEENDKKLILLNTIKREE
jgi:hypothetical protein